MSKSDIEKVGLVKSLLKGVNIPFIKKSSTFGLVYAKTVIFRVKKHRNNLVQNFISNTFCLNDFLVRFTILFRKNENVGEHPLLGGKPPQNEIVQSGSMSEINP